VSGAIGTGTDIVVWGMINCEFASFGRFTALAAKPWFRGCLLLATVLMVMDTVDARSESCPDRVQHCDRRPLDHLVFQGGDAPRIMHLMQLAFGMTGEDGLSLRPISAGVDPHCH